MIFSVHVRSGLDEGLYHRELAGHGREVQRSAEVFIPGINVRVCPNKGSHRLETSVVCGHVQGCYSIAVSGIDVRSRFDQCRGDLDSRAGRRV